MAFIYKIENNLNHKVYIGKTERSNQNRRWQEHKNEFSKDRSYNRALYRAMRKYGIENFTFTVLEETDSPEEREQEYIQLYNSFHYGYNETLGGDGSKVIELPEKEVCVFYTNGHTVLETAQEFNCDVTVIRRILYKNNIQVKSAQQLNKQNRSKAVAKIDRITNEVLEIFPSVIEAERQCDPGRHISQVCKGKRKTAGGFIWKYVEELNL